MHHRLEFYPTLLWVVLFVFKQEAAFLNCPLVDVF